MADDLLLAVGQVAVAQATSPPEPKQVSMNDGQAPFRRAMLYSGEIAS